MKRFFLKNAIVAASIPAVLLTGASFSAASAQTQPRQLSFAQRVAYQYAIEEVYWRHRIWPKENPGPKPSLDEVMSSAQIEKKVENYLHNSQLLASYWQRPITSEQLQAEMSRMASQTKQPEVLQELFAALGNAPFLIVECLARPVLSERLVKQLYAHDERIHGELKRRAKSELRACRSIEEMKQTLPAAASRSEAGTASGTYSEVEWIRSDDQSSRAEIDNGIVGHAHRLPTQQSAAPKAFGADLQRREDPNLIRMTDSEWEESIEKLAAQFDRAVGRARPQGAPTARENDTANDLERIRVGALDPIQEDDTRYFANAVLKKDKDRLKLAIVTWAKEPFESWAAKADIQLPKTADESAPNYTLPVTAESSTPDAPSDCADNTWTPLILGNYPSARDSLAVWTGSEMIVWGGYGGSYLNSGGKYNPSTDSWVATNMTSAPLKRFYHTLVWTGTEMIVWGGYFYDGNDHFLNTGGRYNPTTDTWVATSLANAPSERATHTAVWTGSEMIVWGGENGPILNTGGRYNPTTDSWLSTSMSNIPTGRYGHVAVWTGNQMIVWGGSDGNFRLNTGGRYNPVTDSWAATTMINAPSGRDSHSVVWTGTEMIVWGGFDGSVSLNSGGRYNPGTDNWITTTTTNAPIARWVHTAVWSGSEMIVWGGGNASGSGYLDSGAKYNPMTDSWIATSSANAPSARTTISVWTGAEMIVWGGNSPSGYLDSGGRYNPSTDTWIAMVGSNTPRARSYHTTVWSGSEMIIWSGFDGGNTGGRYNPATASWLPTATTNAPSSRRYHAAIWTGSEMIIWGGYSSSGTYPTVGGRYQPSTDSWTTTSTINAPIGRELYPAIWTGTEMIVWAGYPYTNTGGRYNPSTDSWAAVTLNNAPTARRSHTAVWTGNEMIVWGGANLGTGVILNTGGRYNPSTDSWVATSIANPPTSRFLHTAIWTGNTMIVWGGWNGSADLDTGGRYNPSTDSWLTTSATNAPSARDSHTAIWTGREMIAWGGDFYDGSDHYLNTGGRYNPGTDGWVATTTTNAPSGRYGHGAVWTGSEMITWGGYDGDSLNTGGRYCVQQAAPVAQNAVSRKNHGLVGAFSIDLPLTGMPGIECRAGGATNDYSIVVTFASAVTVNGSPQAQIVSGTGTVGSGGVSNGGMVTISGNSVTIPLTNVANAQTINVRLNGVTGSSGSGNITVPMSILVGDTNANAAVNSGDVAQTKARLGQTLDATNFRSDVNANGAINAGDVSQIKSLLGTGLP